jgi:hypothetical protein
VRRLLVVGALAAGLLAAPAGADPPLMTGWPGNLTAEATSPAGAVVSYPPPVATAGGKSVDVVCTPPPGSTFPLGSTPASCTAKNPDTGEKSSMSFSVTVVDTTGPAWTGDANANVEATGPTGLAAGYTAPTARDLVDGVRPVTCLPDPVAPLPFGDTAVRCIARDTRGNTTTTSFTLTVRDSKPPEFARIPGEVDEQTDGPRPIVVVYDEPTATDLVDGVVAVECDPASGEKFPLGDTTVTCTATDKKGNTATASFDVVVQDLTPPGAVRAFRAVTQGHSVRLSWTPPTGDVAGVEITRSPGRRGAGTTVLFHGSGSSTTDPTAVPGTQYRYRALAFDQSGNRSQVVTAAVSAATSALLAPADGARLSSPPSLRWRASAGAGYYNVQIYKGGRKVFTTWPKGTTLQLPSAWTFEGRRYRLSPGVYTWYVWPGLGPLSAARYGPLVGRSSFTIVRGPDAA